MDQNSLRLATLALDIMHDLPPSNPLSLANTQIEHLVESTGNDNESKLFDLPPLHGGGNDSSLIEIYKQLLEKLSTVREQLKKCVELSSFQTAESLPPEKPAENLSEMIEGIQQGVEKVSDIEEKLANLEIASQNMKRASEQLASLMLSEEMSRLNTIQEVFQNCCTRL